MPPGYTFCGLRRTTLPGTSVNIDQRYHGSKHEVKGTSARWLLLAVNFGELRQCEVRRTPQPVEKVVIGPVGGPKPHPNTKISRPKHCNGGVYESLKETRKRRRGVFQQADLFCDVG